MSQDFLLQVFFMNHLPQVPENNTRVISNFSKIGGDIRKSKCTTSINDTVANLKLVLTILAANFATGIAAVIDTGGKLATRVNDTGGKSPPV
jgi:hypothetical protein